LDPEPPETTSALWKLFLPALAKDKDREVKIKDFREYLTKEGLPQPDAVTEDTDTYFLARLRDRIVNQGMQPLVEREAANPYQIYEADEGNVGGRAKGIEHLEDYVFSNGTAWCNTKPCKLYRQPLSLLPKHHGKVGRQACCDIWAQTRNW
jgi:hypothetical protein